MDRCNELCTKDATGTCTLCESRAEADRFVRFWFKGGLFVDGVHAMQKRGVFTLLHRYALPLALLFSVGLMLWLGWLLPRSIAWRSTITGFVHENPVFVIALLISLLIPLFWLLLWKLPQWQVAAVPEMKDRIDLESKSRQTLAQILGGAALLIGLYFTSQTLRTTQEGQITDRFTKAITQLGDSNLAVRLGGIYALERIARDSASDHWSVMEVLTAFVREYSHGRSNPPWAWVSMLFAKDRLPEAQAEPQPPADIQAVLTVIGRRTRTFGNGETQRLDLNDAILQGANLREAQLQGANLRKAQLQGARLYGAQLQDAYLDGAQPQKALLEEAQLQKAHLYGAQLQDARLWRAQLQGAHLDVAQLQKADLRKAQLQGARLWRAQLQYGQLGEAQLQGADLGWAQLQGAFLVGAQLQDANLREAQLQGAHLDRAQLQDAVLQDADLLGAQLLGADLRGAEYLVQDQINRACTDKNTQLPEGLTRPAPCPTNQ